MKPKRWIPWRDLLPAPWRRRLRRWVQGGVYTGDYASWAEACEASEGYDSPTILEKTLVAARAVRDGRAAWERDTVQFAEPACNGPLLEALRAAAAAEGGRLNVVDFGGALGSTWFQHRTWLQDLPEVRWSIVEQAAVVTVGQREFTGGPLQFYPSLAACCQREQPTVILLSGVLAYLEEPHALLAEIRERRLRHVILDRTGFTTRGRDWLTVQHVPASIYAATYPCWFLDRRTFLEPWLPAWEVVAEWATSDHVDIDATYRGLYLRLRS